MTKSNTAVVTQSNVAELKALEEQLKAKQRLVKAAQELAEWETATIARNPEYVAGSVRKATETDAEVVGHSHGLVCEIKCRACGEVRVVNKQDAFQVHFCVACRKEAAKESSKEKRLQKKMASTSKESLQAEIAKLEALLASK